MEPTIAQNEITGRPKDISRGTQFLALSLTIGLITAIVNLAQRVSGLTLLLASLVVILFFGVGFLLISRISARRNWARIVWLVLILFGLPFAIRGNLAEVKRNALSGAFAVIVTLLQVVGTYFLFTKSSNQWFRTRK